MANVELFPAYQVHLCGVPVEGSDIRAADVGDVEDHPGIWHLAWGPRL